MRIPFLESCARILKENIINPIQRNTTSPIQSATARAPYYAEANIQMSAKDGAKSVDNVDAKLKNSILSALAGQGDGRISLADIKTILKAITDGPLGEPAYSKGEAPLVRMLLAATDDRADVQLDGQKVRIETGAEELFKTELPKFWGSIGGKKAAANRAAAEIDPDMQNALGLDAQKQPGANIGGTAGPKSVFNAQLSLRAGQDCD